MTMCNLSRFNEKLIDQTIDNVDKAPEEVKVNRLYWSIINNSIFKSITEYSEFKDLVDDDAIAHHGSKRIEVKKQYSGAQDNIAKALIILRVIMPYKTAKTLVSDINNLKKDCFYQVIDSFKYKCNSDFYSIFDLKRQ
jgi:hypothetical protein